MLDRKYNSKRPLVFYRVVLTKTLGNRKAKKIWARINRQFDLWEKVIHAGLVRDSLVKDISLEGCVKGHVEEEEDRLARRFNSTVISGKLWQAVSWVTNRKGGVFSRGTSAQRLGDQLWTSSRRNTHTCMYPCWKTPRARPSRSTRRCRRRCLLTYWRI